MPHDATLPAVRDADRRADAEALANPTPLLLVAVGVAVYAGFFWHPRAYGIGAVLAVLLLIGLAGPLATTHASRVTIRPRGRRTRVGQATEVEVTLRGSRWAPLRGIMLRPAAGAAWAARPLSVSWISRGAEVKLSWQLAPTRRGRFPSGDVDLTSSAPFRAYTSRVSRRSEPEALAWPEVVDLVAGDQATASGGGGKQDALLTEGGWQGEVTSPRPYRPGESVKRIHWPQSTRRDELIVCDREAEQQAAVRISLELAYEDAVATEAIEAAIGISASLVTAYARRPGGVRFESPGGRVFRCREPKALPALLDYLALVQPSAGVGGAEGSSMRRDGALVVKAVLPAASATGRPVIAVGDHAVSVDHWRDELPRLWESCLV